MLEVLSEPMQPAIDSEQSGVERQFLSEVLHDPDNQHGRTLEVWNGLGMFKMGFGPRLRRRSEP